MTTIQTPQIKYGRAHKQIRLLSVRPHAEQLARELGALCIGGDTDNPVWHAPDGSKISEMLDARLLGKPVPCYALSSTNLDEALSWRALQDDLPRVSPAEQSALMHSLEGLHARVLEPKCLRENVRQYQENVPAIGAPALMFKVNANAERISSEWVGDPKTLPAPDTRRDVEDREARRLFDQDGCLRFSAVRSAYEDARRIASVSNEAFNTAHRAAIARVGDRPDLAFWQLEKWGPQNRVALKKSSFPAQADVTEEAEAAFYDSRLCKGHPLIAPVYNPDVDVIPEALASALLYNAAWKEAENDFNLNTLERTAGDNDSREFAYERALMIAPARTVDELAEKLRLQLDGMVLEASMESRTVELASALRDLKVMGGNSAHKDAAPSVVSDFSIAYAKWLAVSTGLEERLNHPDLDDDDLEQICLERDQTLEAVFKKSARSNAEFRCKVSAYFAVMNLNGGKYYFHEMATASLQADIEALSEATLTQPDGAEGDFPALLQRWCRPPDSALAKVYSWRKAEAMQAAVDQ